MEKSKKIKIIFWSIILIAILVRVIGWPGALSEVNCDEAMTAINAKAIADTGKDIYGTSFPVYLEAWQYTGQSVMLMYFIAIFIKIFGASLFVVRLPMLLISIVSLFVVYDFSKRIFRKPNIALTILALVAISPWHIMQARWSLDCNLFPHFLLFSLYFLYLGVRTPQKKFLFASMILFGLTMYTYGVSIYLVPLLLLVLAIYLIRTQEITGKELGICVIIYLLISLPILLMYVVNFFRLGDIHLGPITIQYFEQTARVQEMLFFSEHPLQQLMKNLDTTAHVVVLQQDQLVWNSIPGYGTMYIISIFFCAIGAIELIRNNRNNSKIGRYMLFLWLGLSVLMGAIFQNTNINKLNCIWYPMLILAGYGICKVMEFCKEIKPLPYVVTVMYTIFFLAFGWTYFNQQIDTIGENKYWSQGLNSAMEYASDSKAKKIQLDTSTQQDGSSPIYFNYMKGFHNLSQKECVVAPVKEIQEDTIYIVRDTGVTEEMKEKIIKTFYHYVVIQK